MSINSWGVSQLPTARLLGVFESGSAQWLSVRKAGVGGSDVGAILGLNPWESAFTAWAKKCELIAGRESSLAMRAGNFFERPIKEFWLSENSGYEIFETGSWQRLDTPWAMANPDGILKCPDGSLELLEIKTSRFVPDELPPHYQAQVMWYLWVLGMQRGRVIFWSQGCEFKEFFVDFNDFEQEANLGRVTRWWDCVQSGEQPEWDGAANTYETKRELHPDITPDSVDLGDTGQVLLNLLADQVYIDSEINKLKCEVLDIMGSAKVGLVDGREVCVRQARKGGTPYLVMKGK